MFRTLILLILGGGMLLLAVLRLRKHRLKERYALLFVLTALPFLALAAWPAAIGQAALWLGIDYRTVVLLCISTFLILMVFELLTIVSLQDRKITTLAQMIGILGQKQQKMLERLDECEEQLSTKSQFSPHGRIEDRG